jgi:hypothetical protein
LRGQDSNLGLVQKGCLWGSRRAAVAELRWGAVTAGLGRTLALDGSLVAEQFQQMRVPVSSSHGLRSHQTYGRNETRRETAIFGTSLGEPPGSLGYRRRSRSHNAAIRPRDSADQRAVGQGRSLYTSMARRHVPCRHGASSRSPPCGRASQCAVQAQRKPRAVAPSHVGLAPSSREPHRKPWDANSARSAWARSAPGAPNRAGAA